MKTISLGLVIGATLASSVGSTFRSLNSSIGQLQAKTNGLKVKISVGEQWQSLRAESMKLSAALQAGKLDNAGVQRFYELKKATAAAAEEAKKYGFTVGELNKQLEAMRVYSGHQEGFRARAEARATRKEERSEMYGQLAGTMAVGTAMFGYPLKVAMDFEQAMAEVGAISRANAEDTKLLTANSREMGRTTRFSATEAAMGQKYLAMAGFNPEQIAATMPGMLDLATAANMDLARTADISSNILTGFGMNASEMTRVANVMALAFSSSNTDVEQLGYAMKYAAPQAKTLGFSIEQTAAVVSKLSDAGIQGQMAGTTLRGMLDSLTAPSKKAADLLGAPQIKTTDEDGSLRELPDIIKDLDSAMSKAGLGSARKAGIVQEIFGARAGTGANAIWDAVLSGGLEKLTQKYVTEQDGAVARMAAKMNDTARGALIQLGSAFESVGIDIGNVLLPPLKDVVRDLAVLVGKASEFLREYPGVTKAVVGLAAGFVGLKAAALGTRIGWAHIKDGASIAMDVFQRLRPSVLRNALEIGKMGSAGSSLGGVFSSLGAKIGAFKTGAAADFGALKALGGAVFTPLTLSVAALAGAVYLVWKNWDDVSKAWNEGWEKIEADLADGKVGQAFVDLAATIGNVLKPILNDILTPIANVLGNIVQGIGKVVGGVGKVIESGLEKTGLGLSEEGKANGYDYSQSADMWTFGGGALVNPDQNASGGFIERPTLSWIGEDGPEFVVPVGAAYRQRGRSLLAHAASALGLTVMSGQELSNPGRDLPAIDAEPAVKQPGILRRQAASETRAAPFTEFIYQTPRNIFSSTANTTNNDQERLHLGGEVSSSTDARSSAWQTPQNVFSSVVNALGGSSLGQEPSPQLTFTLPLSPSKPRKSSSVTQKNDANTISETSDSQNFRDIFSTVPIGGALPHPGLRLQRFFSSSPERENATNTETETLGGDNLRETSSVERSLFQSGGSPSQGLMDAPQSLAPRPRMAMAGAAVDAGGGVTVNVYPSLGMDEQALADAVIRKIEEYQTRRSRGSYSDDAFFG